jgi:SAM-dependent methyltransferase
MKSSAVSPARDAYGQELWNCHQGKTTYEIVERDDGFLDPGSALPYFADYPQWPPHEREAILRARGPALDIGCGAGRVALYLQQQGHEVLAIDNSPLAIKVARARGVRSTRVVSIRDIGALRGPFATIVMYGNNFGLFGGLLRARRLLAAMHRITTPDAVILAAATDPYQTSDPVHRAYHRRNRARGRMPGQIRMRIRYRQFTGDWFDYLFASPGEIDFIAAPTRWTLSDIVPSSGPGFVAILKKRAAIGH